MGIESDKVVYEYLSRVGDVAQQRQLPSATRMRLVSELRNEIDRRRAKVTVDSPVAVRRIIDHLGTPDDVVTAAGGTAHGGTVLDDGGAAGGAGGSGNGWGGGAPGSPSARSGEGSPTGRGGFGGLGGFGGGAQPPSGAVPAQPESGDSRPKRLRRGLPRPRPAEPQARPQPSAQAPSPSPPAGGGELGGGPRSDWWRVENRLAESVDSVPGFVGGVEIPDLLKPPRRPDPDPEPDTAEGAPGTPSGAGDAAGAAIDAADPAVRRRRFFLPSLRPAAGWTNPLLLIAAMALVVGAALGNWVALILGWLIAYGSRRLTPAETKWAVMGMPGLVAAAAIVWLWGRTDGRWGTPIAEGHMRDALADTWPWVVRGAAVASALYLLWRSQRRR